ncbi:putative serine carboxypeptidase CPVL-like protein, partial [Leptotrombidium deliense]
VFYLSSCVDREHSLYGALGSAITKAKNKSAPLLIWLQGGPGYSSLFGLFVENGPFHVTKGFKLKKRKYSWTKEYSMIYFDFPIGVGFSFTEHEDGYCKHNEQCIDDLYNALQQFYKLFPEMKSNDLYITGQSYGCKFITGLAHKIHNEKNAGIKLKGLAIGGAFCDPPTHVDHGENLYQFSLIDEKQKQYFDKQRDEIRKLMNAKIIIMLIGNGIH